MNHSNDIVARMAAAGLPADNLKARQAALSGPIRALHARIIKAIGATGTAPDAAQVQAWAQGLGVDAADSLADLATAELIFTDRIPDGGMPEVTGGVPFAAGGTSAHRVRVAGVPELAANCAVDALGIGPMLRADSDVTSTDQLTGDQVTATSRAGVWSWEPPTAVVFVGASGDGPLTLTCCPVINFFTNESNARTYQNLHHLTGDVLTMPDAAAAGAAIFGGLLAPNAQWACGVGLLVLFSGTA